MTRKRMGLLTAALVVLCASFITASGQQRSTSSPRRIARIAYSGDMASLLSALAETFDANIGLETELRQPRRAVKIELSEATLEDALNAIVQSAPNYQWRSDEGFIDFYPRRAASPFLDTSVNHFQANGNDWQTATDVLMSLPDVHE